MSDTIKIIVQTKNESWARENEVCRTLPWDTFKDDEQSVVIDHPILFYGVFKFDRLERNQNGTICFWWEDKLTGRFYPMNTRGLTLLLTTSEFQAPGIIDGKWELRVSGENVSVYPFVEKAKKRRKT